MKSAIIGIGVIGKVHLETLLMQSRDVVALCDIDLDKAKKVAESFGLNVPVYSDWKEMINAEKPDSVHVCTPHYLHTEMVIGLLEKNIHVLCEKPLCINKSDIPLILEAERKSSATLGVCHQNRYNPATVFVKDYLKDKKMVGAYGSMVWNRSKDYYESADWRGKKATEGGGVLINQALHTLDLMQYFCQMPTFVTASAENLSLKDVIEVEDTVSAIFDGDTPFTFFATNASANDFPVEIKFKLSSGEIVSLFPRAAIAGGQYKEFPKALLTVSGKSCYGSSHYYLFEDFYGCINEGRHFPIDGAEGAKVVRLILSAYESKKEKIKI